MPIDRYFDKFPIINYANNTVVDITRRVTITNLTYANPFVFYPYDLTSFERPDQFSSRYYQDSFKSWLVYLSNKIVDPYYEWYLQENEFYQNLENKYGSIYNAQTKIKYYRHNWEEADNISTSYYSAMVGPVKKYWLPVYDERGSVYSYERIKKDWILNTNKIFVYNVSNSSFITNEICDIVFDVNNVGKGQVLQVSNTSVYLQHLSGTYETSDEVSIDGNSYIYGTESTVNTIFTTANCVANNILPEEEIYWKAVTYFDYEYEKNEYNKTIRVLDSSFAPQAAVELYDLMRQ